MFDDWHALGEVVYRKWPVYTMGWGEKFNFDDYLMCGAAFGGPLAFVPSTNKPDQENSLLIFSSSGVKIAEVPWKYQAVAGMGWTDHEQLAILLLEGTMLIYSIHGLLLKQFMLWDASSSVHVLECKFWGNGVVAMVSDMTLFVAEGLCTLDSIKRHRMVTGFRQDRPHTSMAIIPPSLSRHGLLEVLLGSQDNSIIIVDENEVEDQLLQDRIGAPVTKMSVAPNGRFIACYRRDGVLAVMSTTFTTKVLEFDTKSMSRPMSIEWCGDDSVVLVWRNTGIVMVGPFGDWLNFPYDGPVQIVPEHDCCRIITGQTCELLQLVPPSTEAIRRIGSTDPAALLYDATEAFEAGDPKSDENLRDIAATNQLGDAVRSCLQAATAEFDIAKQQSLLKAAAYGKAFSQVINPNEFVDVAKKLRILNEIRQPHVGMPLTMQQLNKLSIDAVIGRLIVRNEHFLVIRICEWMKMNYDKVIVHWACEKVKKMASMTPAIADEEIFSVVKERVQNFIQATGRKSAIKFIEIAKAAFHANRRRVAIMLLDMEYNPVEQVPLLLSMQEDELALHKAVVSEDTDLIYLAVMQLEKIAVALSSKEKNTLELFFQLISNYTEAVNLLKAYYRSKPTGSDRSVTLNALLLFQRNFLEAGLEAVLQSHQNAGSRVQMLRDAVSFFNGVIPQNAGYEIPNSSASNSSSNLGKDIGGNRDAQSIDMLFMRTATEDQIELLDVQKALEIRSQREFINLTLTETLFRVVNLGVEFPGDAQRWETEFQKITKRFKVSEKVICKIRLQSFAKHGLWSSVAKLAFEKKPPIGFIPFARVLMSYNQPTAEIEKYIEKVGSSEDKFDLLLECKSWKKAAEVAYKLRDSQRLEAVARMSGEASIIQYVQELMLRM